VTYVAISIGFAIAGMGTSAQSADLDQDAEAIKIFETALNGLIRAVETAPGDASRPPEDRARIAVGSAVSCFCRTLGNGATWDREYSDANVLECVYAAFIGDLELTVTRRPQDADQQHLVEDRLRQVVSLYPIGGNPGRREMLYLCQIFALVSVTCPTALRDELAKEWTTGQARLTDERGLPFMAAFACMRWPVPAGMDIESRRHTPLFRMLTRQFESTRESTAKLIQRHPTGAEPRPTGG
jgi:hypothetical protein